MIVLTHEEAFKDELVYLPAPVDLTRGRTSLPTTNWGHRPFTAEELDAIAPISDQQLDSMRNQNEVPAEVNAIIQKRIAAVRRLGDRRIHDQTIDLS